MEHFRKGGNLKSGEPALQLESVSRATHFVRAKLVEHWIYSSALRI